MEQTGSIQRIRKELTHLFPQPVGDPLVTLPMTYRRGDFAARQKVIDHLGQRKRNGILIDLKAQRLKAIQPRLPVPPMPWHHGEVLAIPRVLPLTIGRTIDDVAAETVLNKGDMSIWAENASGFTQHRLLIEPVKCVECRDEIKTAFSERKALCTRHDEVDCAIRLRLQHHGMRHIDAYDVSGNRLQRPGRMTSATAYIEGSCNRFTQTALPCHN